MRLLVFPEPAADLRIKIPAFSIGPGHHGDGDRSKKLEFREIERHYVRMTVFPHTNLRTDHSFRDAADTPEVIAERIRAAEGIGSIADHETLAGGLEIHKALKGSRSKIGVGVCARLEVGTAHLPIRLHPRTQEGWKSLCRLSVRKGGPALTTQDISSLHDVSLVIQGPVAAYPFNTDKVLDTRRIEKAYSTGGWVGECRRTVLRPFLR